MASRSNTVEMNRGIPKTMKFTREVHSDKIKDIFKPILFLFLFTGMDLNKSARKWQIITFSVFFYAMFLQVTITQFLCILEKFNWNWVVSISLKITSLILWCFIWKRKEKIYSLLEMLESLKAKLDHDNFKKLQRHSKIATAFVALVICAESAGQALRYINPHHQSDIDTCYILKSLDSTSMTASAIFIIYVQLSAYYVNISVTYAVALFYATYCQVLSLCLADEQRSRKHASVLFQQVIAIFKNLEEVLSLAIFVVFAYFLTSLFKDMIVLISVLKEGKFDMAYAYLFDFVVNAILMTVVVLAAEDAQNRVDDIRETLYAFLEDTPGDALVLGRFIRISEGCNRLRLTGWGTFTIRKPLLLTLLTWLVTYGVIILQLSPS